MYEDLYRENIPLLRRIAWRFRSACLRDRAVSVEDLTQAGFFGLVQAQKTYNPDKGNWAAWAAWAIVREIYKALGYRDGKPIKAHTGALSLDAPIIQDKDDDITGLDLLEDNSLPPIDEDLNRENLVAYVRAAVERMENDRQRAIIQLCDINGLSYEAAAQELDISAERVRQIRQEALKSLRKDKRLQEDAAADIDLKTPYYRPLSVSAFHRIGASATEKAAFYRIEAELRLKAARERYAGMLEDLENKRTLGQEKRGR